MPRLNWFRIVGSLFVLRLVESQIWYAIANRLRLLAHLHHRTKKVQTCGVVDGDIYNAENIHVT